MAKANTTLLVPHHLHLMVLGCVTTTFDRSLRCLSASSNKPIVRLVEIACKSICITQAVRTSRAARKSSALPATSSRRPIQPQVQNFLGQTQRLQGLSRVTMARHSSNRIQRTNRGHYYERQPSLLWALAPWLPLASKEEWTRWTLPCLNNIGPKPCKRHPFGLKI